MANKFTNRFEVNVMLIYK